MKQALVEIPDNLVKKLDLKDGDIIEAKAGKGKLFLLKKESNLSGFMKFAGIWKNDKTDEVFREIRAGWNKWAKKLPA